MGSCMSSSGLSGGSTVHRPVSQTPAMPIPQSYDLPSGWVCQYDPQNQRLFYINQMTGQRQWEHPRGPMAGANDAAAYRSQMSRHQYGGGGGYPSMSQPAGGYGNAYYGNNNYGNPNQSRLGPSNGYNGGMGQAGRSAMSGMGGMAAGGAVGLLAGTLIGNNLGDRGEVNNYYIDQNQNVNNGGDFGNNGGFYDQGGGDFGNNGGFYDQGGGDFFMDNGGDAGFFDQGGGDSGW